MTFLVFSNLFIALAAVAFTHESYYLLGADPHLSPLLALVFCATLIVYDLDRLSGASSEDTVDATRRHRWVDRHRRLLWATTGLAAIGAVTTLFFVPRALLWALIPLGLVSLGYSLPVIWSDSGPYRLKDIAGLKIFLISFVWAGATALLPAVEVLDDPLTPEVAWLIAERALFIFAITLPFDIRDMDRDRHSAIWTIPLAVGPDRTRRLAYLAVAAFGVCVGLHYGLDWQSPALPLWGSATVTTALLSRAGRENHDEMYYVGWLDGMIPLQWAFVAGWATCLPG
ncbi:MAG: UbiA family prenyltransferase [Bradymonadaceae bacterium]